MPHRLFGAVTGLFLVSLVSLSAQAIDFSGASDYANNFRVAATGSMAPTVSIVNGALQATGSTTTSASLVYDTTRSDGKTTENLYSGNVTISFDFNGSAVGNSMGVFFTGASETTTATTVLSMDNGTPSPDEWIRFFQDTILESSPGNVSSTTYSVASGANVGTPLHVVLNLAFSGTTPTLTMTVGSAAPVSYTYAAGAIPASYEIGFRLGINSANSTTTLDNIVITQVPEPGVVSLIGLGLLGLAGVSCARRLRTP